MDPQEIVFKNQSLDLEIRFSVVGYEFPDITAGQDSDWLVVRIVCAYKGHQFIADDPCLETPELRRISTWFDDISRNRIPKYVTEMFTEPCLAFALHGRRSRAGDPNAVRFGIELNAELKPPFFIDELSVPVDPDDSADPLEPFHAVFVYSQEDLREYGRKFRDLCEAFPARQK